MKVLVALPSFILTPLSIVIAAIKEASLLALANLSELPIIINEEIIQEIVDYYSIDTPVKDLEEEEEVKEEAVYGYSA